MPSEAVLIAVLSLIGTLVGSYLSSRKTTAIVVYRLEELEKKVEKHNNLVERVYKLEESNALQDAELKRINKRLENVEGGQDDGK